MNGVNSLFLFSRNIIMATLSLVSECTCEKCVSKPKQTLTKIDKPLEQLDKSSQDSANESYELEDQQQEEKTSSKSNRTTVFIDFAREDQIIASQYAEQLLQEHNYKQETLREHTSSFTRRVEELEDILINKCDEVFVIYEKTPLSWVINRVTLFHRIQSFRLNKENKTKPLLIHFCSPNQDKIDELISYLEQRDMSLPINSDSQQI